jgi:hypothetical protein
MTYCSREKRDFDAHDFVYTHDGIVHIIAPAGAREAIEGHRIDGLPVRDLQAVRDSDGSWRIVKFDPRTRVPVLFERVFRRKR